MRVEKGKVAPDYRDAGVYAWPGRMVACLRLGLRSGSDSLFRAPLPVLPSRDGHYGCINDSFSYSNLQRAVENEEGEIFRLATPLPCVERLENHALCRAAHKTTILPAYAVLGPTAHPLASTRASCAS